MYEIGFFMAGNRPDQDRCHMHIRCPACEHPILIRSRMADGWISVLDAQKYDLEEQLRDTARSMRIEWESEQ